MYHRNFTFHLQTAEIEFFFTSQKITAITFMTSCKKGGRVRAEVGGGAGIGWSRLRVCKK